jgi:hypothetical protein
LSGLRMWHNIHTMPWYGNDKQLEKLIAGAQKLAPKDLRKKQRGPHKREELEQLKGGFDLSKPLDAAVYAVATVSFYSLARLGELTVPTEKAYKETPDAFARARDIKRNVNRDGLPTVGITLPRSKTSRPGRASDILLVAPLHDASGTPIPTCPVDALETHLRVNAPDEEGEFLFTYKKESGARAPLTKKKFLERLAKAASCTGVKMPHGHAFRIGGTLHYILKGLPFDAVRVIGRWASACWQKYLREHAEILAPYIQEDSERYLAFTREYMPTALR